MIAQSVAAREEGTNHRVTEDTEWGKIESERHLLQAFLIHRFEQPWSHEAMNFDGRTYDRLSQRVMLTHLTTFLVFSVCSVTRWFNSVVQLPAVNAWRL